MKMTMFTLLMLIAFVSPGCAGAPKQREVAAANYGAYPSNYNEIVHGWIRQTFFDPHTLRDLKIGEPEKFWVQDSILEGRKMHYGYMVAVALNGKNRFGAYVGIQAYRVLIRDGRVIAHQWANQPNREVTGPDWVFQ